MSAVILPLWREALAAWCREFDRLLERGWDQSSGSALFARIESQTSLTDLVADPAVAEIAAELTVYMCGFAEGEAEPDDDQCLRLHQLNSQLYHALLQEPAPASAARGVPARNTVRRIYYVRPRERDLPHLAAALGQARVAVQPLDDIASALQAMARAQPDAVILDASLLRELSVLSEASRRTDAGSYRRVLWAAVGVEKDLQLRLFARRAGIDLLLDSSQVEQATTALLAALLRRREQAFRVLVVEDDRSQSTFFGALLRHQGFEVDIAASAAAALERVTAHAPDLVLLDINLPDMSGIELAQLLRDRESLAHVPVIFLTGEEDSDLRSEAIAAGGDDFLVKPIRPRHLIANVTSRIGRARALAAAVQAEPIDESFSVRLDRMRLVEGIEQARRESSRCLAVAVLAMDDVGEVASRLGFVRAGDLALQIALAIEAEAQQLGPTCGIGEFSRLVLVEAESEFGLRRSVEALCRRLEARGWLSTSFPLRIRFSAGVVRYDGATLSPDAIIAAAMEALGGLRNSDAGRGIGFRSFSPETDPASDPLRRIARLMLSQPLKPSACRLQFRPLLPLRGTRGNQFLVRTLLAPPGSRSAERIGPDVLVEIAEAIGAQASLDRVSIEAVAHYARSASVAKNGWTVLLPVSETSLQEGFFTDWLQRAGAQSAQLQLVVGADRLRAGSGLVAALDRIAALGWHWIMRVAEPEQLDVRALSLPNLDALILEGLGAEPQRWSAALALAQSHGKAAIATGLDELRQVGALFASGVHYGIGDAVGDWADEPPFEATRPRDL